MATGTRRAPAKKASPKAQKPAPEPEDLEEEDDDIEELEEDEATESAPKGKKGAVGRQEVTFGVSDLAELLAKETGDKVTTRGLRTLIRKMARDGSGRVEREIVAGNRTRYDWSGPKDAEVIKIIKAYKAGELEADKQEKLDALKESSAKKKAAAEKLVSTKTATGKKKKAAAPVVEDDDDDELEELDDDEE